MLLFVHGWQSTPGGLKPTHLKNHGHEVLNPHLPDDDFDAAIRIAQMEFDQGKPDVVVGSSRGGAVAINIDTGDTPLVLLCPAWKNWGTATTVKSSTTILHSKPAETIPFDDSRELLHNSGLSDLALIEVGTEHRLADPESLAAMLRACERAGSTTTSILDHPAISGHYLFPQPRCIHDPFMVDVYGLMVYLPAFTVPEDRSARPPRWWHYPVAVVLPILAAVPVVPVVVFLRQWLGIESFPGA